MRPTSASEREHQYRFLASLYLRPPSESLLGMIRDGSIVPAFAGGPGEEGPADLREFLAETPGLPGLEEELAAEHAALFVLPSGVIPHEAFYLDPDKRLGGKVTIAVQRFYAGAGLSLLEHCIEMPDHLGLELEFMAALCRLEGELEETRDAAALPRCVEFQRTFLEEHLSRWAPECCENVIRHARRGWYRAIAHFTLAFLRSERAHLGGRHAEGARLCEPVQST